MLPTVKVTLGQNLMGVRWGIMKTPRGGAFQTKKITSEELLRQGITWIIKRVQGGVCG